MFTSRSRSVQGLYFFSRKLGHSPEHYLAFGTTNPGSSAVDASFTQHLTLPYYHRFDGNSEFNGYAVSESYPSSRAARRYVIGVPVSVVVHVILSVLFLLFVIVTVGGVSGAALPRQESEGMLCESSSGPYY